VRPTLESLRQAGKRDGGGDAGAGAADGPLPKPAEHLQRKVLRRVRFLEKVAAARPRPALAPSGGVRKKKRRRPPHGRAAQLPDLSTLAASLADTAHDLERRKAAPRKGLGVGGAKARSRIVTAETRRLQQVPPLHDAAASADLQSPASCACEVSCSCKCGRCKARAAGRLCGLPPARARVPCHWPVRSCLTAT